MVEIEREPGTSAYGGYLNQLEPDSLVRQFEACPPQDFTVFDAPGGAPGFETRFDLLTTAEPQLRQRLAGLPLVRHWLRWLTVRTAFIGTTVSEYVLLPAASCPAELAAQWRRTLGRRYRLLIVKDVPQDSPLLDAAANARARQLAEACRAQGFVLVEGQALAYVAIDFDSIDGYFARLSGSRRKNLRRKLRSRDALDIQLRPAGDPAFDDEAVLDEYYALYDGVYQQSEIHFDRLTRAFFARLLRDPASQGVSFEYRRRGELIGFNLCFEHGGKLVDKYIGLRYPQARECNLYFVSWVVNLEYALARGLSHYVTGWTDPQVKAELGASFTFTRHAVFVRSCWLRALARRFAGHFENDRQWRKRHTQESR